MGPRFPFPANPNGWFRALYSAELGPRAVRPLDILGRALVAFRDEDGVAHVLDAHCRHLGAHLGFGGRVEGKGIRCPFHAWLWDGKGACIDVPYARHIPRDARLRAWTTAEKNGLILIWHHGEEKPPSFEIPPLPEFGSEEWTPYEIRRWKVRSRWLDMNENAVDQVHFRYVHGTHTVPQTEVELDGHVLRCRSRMKMGTPRGEVDGGIDTTDYGPGFQTVRVTGVVETLMVNTATPIDDEYTDVSFAYSVKRTGGDDAVRGAGSALIRDLEKQMAQDIVIWEHKKYYERPLLCDGDGAFAVYRRWMRQFFCEGAPSAERRT
jgi:phenylpropionate dioxygenase-like ring-hydroxylating dioxygenase large terminal subunit